MKRRLEDRKAIGVAILAVALVVVALLTPLPSVLQVRDWAQSIGSAFPLVFFAVYALVTVFPIPRTVFTLSAGLLFGAWLGITIAVVASMVSAVLALLLVRVIGRDVVWRRISNPTVRRVDERIARRGWLAVGSLRLIAFAPFSVVNYCCGVSSIRLVPYVLATAVGILPGTIGVVVLGDALTGETKPAFLVLSGVCIVAGIVGLIVDSRRPSLRPVEELATRQP
ncbi:TVP38/TMEM64 family protein [Rhodococcus marinonascens]|uniref:TVP38/TMEM64 family protein n=1 Tax=Rhodococcus marinonascens TaxID=38311 RepID=UPI0009336BDC|nr:TVP38/TMEM64 family protein [Rhodococcus marinonascens]